MKPLDNAASPSGRRKIPSPLGAVKPRRPPQLQRRGFPERRLECSSGTRAMKTVADPHQEDLDLILRIRSGKGADEAYRQLLEKYWRLLIAWVRPRLRDPSESEDVVQETFIRAFRAMDSLQNPERVLGWLLRIARNLAADHGRRRRVRDRKSVV